MSVPPDVFTYTVAEPGCAMPVERRRYARQRTRLRSGKVIRGDGQFICECLVHNRSAAGGRIRLQIDADLPDSVFYYDDQSGELFHGAVIWRRPREVGLRLSPCAATAPHRALAARMRRKFYALKR